MMPETVDTFEFRNFGQRSNETHDWDTLLNGKIYKCIEGVDFRVKKLTFMNAARAEAKKRGLKLRTGSTEGGIIIKAEPGDTSDVPEEVNGAAPTAAEPPKPVPPPTAKPATAPVSNAPKTGPKPAVKK